MATTYDERAALVVVDVHNDFTDPAGGLHVREADAVVDEANRHIGAARTAGALGLERGDGERAIGEIVGAGVNLA